MLEVYRRVAFALVPWPFGKPTTGIFGNNVICKKYGMLIIIRYTEHFHFLGEKSGMRRSRQPKNGMLNFKNNGMLKHDMIKNGVPKKRPVGRSLPRSVGRRSVESSTGSRRAGRWVGDSGQRVEKDAARPCNCFRG